MIWLLLIVFQFKHFIADYLLQSRSMLGKFSKDFEVWVPALMLHCLVHFIFTFIITFIFVGWAYAAFLACIDFTIHFIMDRIKVSPDMLGRFKALSAYEYRNLVRGRGKEIPEDYFNDAMNSNKYFWWTLGLDQMVHHLTDILIIYLVINVF